MKRARRIRSDDCRYATRGGLKLEFALRHFSVAVDGLVAGDLGCHKGGFTDCLLQHGAARVYAVDTAYGLLDWKLRGDSRVIVHERTNLLHWKAPEPLDLVVIDAGWTPQRLVIPAALRSLKPAGVILSLVKPQYEAGKAALAGGVLPPEQLAPVTAAVREALAPLVEIVAEAVSPVPGTGGNTEVWLHLRPRASCGAGA